MQFNIYFYKKHIHGDLSLMITRDKTMRSRTVYKKDKTLLVSRYPLIYALKRIYNLVRTTHLCDEVYHVRSKPIYLKAKYF